MGNLQKSTRIKPQSFAIFLSKGFLPTPIDKMLIAVQALFLTLGALMAKPLGATKVSAIGAILTAILRPALAPLTIIFALVYGILTDLFHSHFKG